MPILWPLLVFACYDVPFPSFSAMGSFSWPWICKLEAVDKSMHRRQVTIDQLKFHLLKSHNRMKVQANKHRSERIVQIGDWIWLKLQPYKQMTVQFRDNHNLSPKFFGPFQVKEVILKVAYRLSLPETSIIHDVSNVSQLSVKVSGSSYPNLAARF